jgi:hypothetical protein
MPNFPDSSLAVTGFNPSVVAIVQDRTLQRVFRDAAFPRLLYRMEAIGEMWPVNLGSNQTFTRAGLITPSTRPLGPGVDPTPGSYAVEQWEAMAQQWGKAIDTHMPTSYVTLASQYLRNMHQLGLHAGQSLNRVVRDKLFNTVADGNYGPGTAMPVKNLTGFTKQLVNGRPAAVSASNPMSITVNAVAYTCIGFTSTIPGDEIHGGTLTLTANVTSLDRQAVLATNRSRIVYSNGGTRVDDIVAGDAMTLADIRASVAQMRFDNIPPHEDGSYHWHGDPISESQIFSDTEFQNLNRSMPDYIHYRRFAMAFLLGVTFYRNSEAPNAATVSEDPAYGFTTGFELSNPSSVNIHRAIITGQGAIEEKYLDESRYISEAGIQGKIGEFAVVNGGVQVLTERIRLVLRAPLDRLQQTTGAAWSFSGDWPIPTDATSPTSAAAFKRASVIVHGSA